MDVTERTIGIFAELGKFLSSPDKLISDTARNAEQLNSWFTNDNTRFAIQAWGLALSEEKIRRWLEPYAGEISNKQESGIKNIGVIMAGNIPLAGLHDLLCVVASRNKFLGKCSSKDDKLIPVIAEFLAEAEPSLKGWINFTEGKLENFDAVISTGSDSSARYFEYYFGKYPHIIRRNRNSVAVLSGDETDDELKGLSKDIFIYFGLGCRSVSKLYVPSGYDFNRFFKNMEGFRHISNHHKYVNNYDYYKAIYLLTGVPFSDNGFLLLKEDPAFTSPVAVLHYEKYNHVSEVMNGLSQHKNEIQCVVVPSVINKQVDKECPALPFVLPGHGQMTELWDYADGVDTMRFLLSL